jgi:hypothetical protein
MYKSHRRTNCSEANGVIMLIGFARNRRLPKGERLTVEN